MGQIKEIYKSELGFIGNHSHSHEYLVDEDLNLIKKDLLKSMSIFKELGSNSTFFLIHWGI